MSEDDQPSSKRAQIKELRVKCKAELKAAGKDKEAQKRVQAKYDDLEKGLRMTSVIVEELPQVAEIQWTAKQAPISKSTQKKFLKASLKSLERNAINEANKDDAKVCEEESNAIQALLKTDGLVIEPIPADGSCLFASIAFQIPGHSADTIRTACVEYIRSHPDDFVPFLECSLPENLDHLSTDGWGGELELVAVSMIFSRPVHVYQKSGLLEISSQFKAAPLRVSFHEYLLSEPHYNAVRI